MLRRGRGTTGAEGVEDEVEEEGEVMKVEEAEGGDPLMTGDLRGEMTEEGEGVMVAEMEVKSKVFHGITSNTPTFFRWL